LQRTILLEQTLHRVAQPVMERLVASCKQAWRRGISMRAKSITGPRWCDRRGAERLGPGFPNGYRTRALVPEMKAVCGKLRERYGRSQPGRRSGSVSNHFQLGRAIHCRKKLIDAFHCRLLQFNIAALTALQNRKRPEDDNRRIADLKG
jgi:hypothetical protein